MGYQPITEDTDVSAETATAAADMLAAVRRLSELSRTNEMASMVGVLDALNDEAGPLAALADLFDEAAPWLADFDMEETERAADRTDDASKDLADLRYTLNIILTQIRPLA